MHIGFVRQVSETQTTLFDLLNPCAVKVKVARSLNDTLTPSV